MKKLVLVGLVLSVLVGCEDMPFRGLGRDDFTSTPPQKYLVTIPDKFAQSDRPDSAIDY
ncbi:MAG: hypothetical protein HKM00_02915 [Gallionella sp.]|nr:hypothetical protein [Gallionella sp.]